MNKCIFCQIINKEIKANIVYEDENVIAFRDINPQAPIHILIVPKKHISSVMFLDENDAQYIGYVYRACKEIAEKEKVSQTGFRIVVNTGPDAGQEVQHLHFHFLAGRKLNWPPG
ncbi:MAG: histidine triad nucleotide-binding protein [Endomicrobiia bacterium]